MNTHMVPGSGLYPHDASINPQDTRLWGWGGWGFRPWGFGFPPFGFGFGFGMPFFGFPFFL